MCEPTTIFAIATAASAALGAYGSIQQGRATAQAEYYNAQIAQRNAQAAEEEQGNVKDAAAIERRRLGERERQARGDLVAKYSAMGLDPNFGTPADLIGDVEQAFDIDREIMGRNETTEIKRLDKERADYTDASRMAMNAGDSAWKAGQIGAVGSLLDGVSNVSGRWIMPSPANTNTPPRTKPQPVTTPRIKVGAGK